MRSAVRIGLVALLMGIVAFSFLGVIAYQNAEAISTMHQQGVLKSIGAQMAADSDGRAATSIRLESYPALSSPDFLAAIVDSDGNVLARKSSPGNEAVLAQILATTPEWLDARMFERRMDVDGHRFTWYSTPVPNSDASIVLAHRCMSTPFQAIMQLYVVPIILASLLVIWGAFWAGIMGSRMLRARARERSLELEVVRHEETSRIKSAFLAHMSHELRTPLNAIIGFSQMLKAQMFGPLGSNKNEEYVGLIQDSGQHLLKIVDNLLDLSSIEAGVDAMNESDFDLRQMLGDCTDMLQSQTSSRRQKVVQDHPALMPRLRGDRLKLFQVMLNLVGNASKYADESSTITVRSRLQSDGGLKISVIDQGEGIPQKELERIMQPFVRAVEHTDIAKQGTGLGLPVSKALTELHGGTLTLTSEPGKGTVATVSLPARRVLPAAVETVKAA